MSVMVYNAGVPGDTTVEALARFDRDVASREPDLIIILLGTNDMLYPGHRLAPAEFRRNLERLAIRTAAIGSRLIFGTLPPVRAERFLAQYPLDADPAAELAIGNREIVRAAAEAGELWDAGGIIAAAPDRYLLPDGMHWNAAGCDAAARGLAPLAGGAARIVCLGDSLTHGVYLQGKGSARPDAETYPGRLAFYLQKRA